jgi:hypothetical protein
MYEHFRKRDRRRIANLFKLHSIERSLVLLPGIGEMFRSEATTLRPAGITMRANAVRFTVEQGPSGEYFELDRSSLMSTERRSSELKEKCLTMMTVWRSLRQIPDLRDASPKETPEVIKGLSLKIRNDREDMCGFYANHRQSWFPAPHLLDEKWAFFRWIQVYLLAGLDYISRYGMRTNPNEESIAHELLDLDYLISALLVGGLACREHRILERFRFLRQGGLIRK